MRAPRFATGSASCPCSGVRKLPRSVTERVQAGLGPVDAGAVRELGGVLVGPGRGRQGQVGRPQRPAAVSRARTARTSAPASNTLYPPAGACRYWICSSASGRGCTAVSTCRRIRSSSSGHRLHVVRPDQLHDVERAEVQVGKCDRRGPRGDAVERIGPGDRRADLRRVGQHAASQLSSAGSATDRGLAVAGAVRPGCRCTATRWVSPMPGAGVWTTSGSGGNEPTPYASRVAATRSKLPCTAWWTPSARATSAMASLTSSTAWTCGVDRRRFRAGGGRQIGQRRTGRC